MSWKYEGKDINSVEDIPEGAIGFVYNIVTYPNPKSKVKPKCQEYIGKKNLYSTRWVEVSKNVYDKLKAEGIEEVKKNKNKAKSKVGSVVWRYKKKVVSQTNWEKYFGSSDLLKEDLKAGVGCTRYILHFAYSKQELTYLEEKELFCSGVLEHGDKYYNICISNRYFKK